MIEAITRDVCACTSWPEMASDLRKLCSPGRSRTYVANPDSKFGLDEACQAPVSLILSLECAH